MAWLEWLWRSPRVVDDSLFGRIEYRRRGKCWDALGRFSPLGRDVPILLTTSEENVPDARHHEGFTMLSERYESMRNAIGEALWSHWKTRLKDWRGDRPPLVASAADMLTHTSLDWIEVKSERSFALAYGFTEDVGWDDAFFVVRIEDWNVMPDIMGD